MLTQQQNLYHYPFLSLFQDIKEQVPFYEYQFDKHLIKLMDDNHDSMGYIRLPLHLIIDQQLTIKNPEATVLYLSIESDYACIQVLEGNDTVYHTTFSSYMTRKKQGYSQIKHLNKKGKSRAGSRIRLASTLEFFENINETLATLWEEFDFDRIGLNCSPSLIPYWFSSKTVCPFDKNDDRLYKIPLPISKSNYEQLNNTVKKLKAPILFYNSKYDNHLSFLLS